MKPEQCTLDYATAFTPGLTNPGLATPEGIVAAHGKGRVMRALANGQARDPRVAMGRAVHMGWRELVEAENARAPLGQLIARRAPHRAKAKDDDVVSVHVGLT